MKKIPKGTYGYLKSQRKIETIKTIVLFALAAALFLVGYVTTKTKENLLTVVAVAAVLPAAKQMTTTILFYRYVSGSAAVYEKLEAQVKNATCLSDIVITAYDKVMELLHVAIVGKTIIAFSEKPKTDEKATEDFVKKILEKNGYKGVSIKVYKDENAYTARLQAMQENLQGEKNSQLEEEMAHVIKAISI